MNDTRNVTQNCEEDVDQEIRIAAALKEDTKRWEDDGEDDFADIAITIQCQLLINSTKHGCCMLKLCARPCFAPAYVGHMKDGSNVAIEMEWKRMTYLAVKGILIAGFWLEV